MIKERTIGLGSKLFQVPGSQFKIKNFSPKSIWKNFSACMAKGLVLPEIRSWGKIQTQASQVYTSIG